MITHRQARALLYVALITVTWFVLQGCASSTFVPTSAMEKKLDTFKTAYFTSESGLAEDLATDLFTFEEETAKRLTKSKLFSEVKIGKCGGACENTLQLHARITNLHKVSGGARFFLGVFAGEAYVEATLMVVDVLNNDTLGVYEVRGTSGSSGMSGDTKSAFQHAAKAVVNVMKENFSQ